MPIIFGNKKRSLTLIATKDELGQLALEILHQFEAVCARRGDTLNTQVIQLNYGFEQLLTKEGEVTQSLRRMLEQLDVKSVPLLLTDGKPVQPGGFQGMLSLLKDFGANKEEIALATEIAERARNIQASIVKRYILTRAALGQIPAA